MSQLRTITGAPQSHAVLTPILSNYLNNSLGGGSAITKIEDSANSILQGAKREVASYATLATNTKNTATNYLATVINEVNAVKSGAVNLIEGSAQKLSSGGESLVTKLESGLTTAASGLKSVAQTTRGDIKDFGSAVNSDFNRVLDVEQDNVARVTSGSNLVLIGIVGALAAYLLIKL